MALPRRAGSSYGALTPRLITSVIGLPLLLGSLWAGGLLWVVVVVVVTVVGALEFARLHPALPQASRLFVVAGALGAAALIVLVPEAYVLLALAYWTGSIVLVGLVGVLRAFSDGVLPPRGMWRSRWDNVVFGIVYLGAPGGVLVRWRTHSTFQVVALVLVLIWANDVAAYFVGSRFGRHKLAPRISPGKSWEGTVAGLLVAGILGAGVGSVLGLSAVVGAVFGVVISIASQVGDLFESALKRAAGVKDSGSVLPGHGGVLDRFDGLFFAAPLGYVLLHAWTT